MSEAMCMVCNEKGFEIEIQEDSEEIQELKKGNKYCLDCYGPIQQQFKLTLEDVADISAGIILLGLLSKGPTPNLLWSIGTKEAPGKFIASQKNIRSRVVSISSSVAQPGAAISTKYLLALIKLFLSCSLPNNLFKLYSCSCPTLGFSRPIVYQSSILDILRVV